MDMWRPYRDAVAAVIPHAVVVIDKFHIVKMANEGVEAGRKDLRSKLTKEQSLQLKRDRWLLLKRQRDLATMDEAMLNGWIENYPELYALHKAKEGFCDIWDQHCSRNEAIAIFNTWIESIPESVFQYFEGMISTVRNWHLEAFNYFDHRVTNAYTESANNHIKSIAKQGRGYSFEVLRARVLFIGAKHKIRPKPFKHGVAEKSIGYALPDDLVINYGVEIPHDPDIS